MGMVAIFTYGFSEAEKKFKNVNIPYTTLCNYDTMIDAALEMGYVKKEEMDLLIKWRESPETWEN